MDDRGRYQGCVTLAGLETLREGSEATTLADCPETPRPVLEPHASLWEAMQQLQKVTGEAIAVVDDERRFLGVAYESSIARAFLHHSDALRREEHGAG